MLFRKFQKNLIAKKKQKAKTKNLKNKIEKKNIEICSTHDERKSVIAERFIRTLNNKIYKCMTLISKKDYIDKLDYIVNK